MSIFSIYLLISSSIDANLITFLFLVLSILKTSNNLSIGFILIHSSFTSYLSILVWIHLELTSVLSYNLFSFNVFTFVYMLSSLYLLSLLYRIIYQFFRELLCIEVYYTIPTLNLQHNPPLYYCLHCLIPPIYFCSLYPVLTCSSLQGILLCYTCSIF